MAQKQVTRTSQPSPRKAFSQAELSEAVRHAADAARAERERAHRVEIVEFDGRDTLVFVDGRQIEILDGLEADDIERLLTEVREATGAFTLTRHDHTGLTRNA